MAPHSSTLAWKIPWMEEPGRLRTLGSLRVGYDWATSLSLSQYSKCHVLVFLAGVASFCFWLEYCASRCRASFCLQQCESALCVQRPLPRGPPPPTPIAPLWVLTERRVELCSSFPLRPSYTRQLVCIAQSCAPVHPVLSLPPCPQVCSLSLWSPYLPWNRFISIVSLDFIYICVNIWYLFFWLHYFIVYILELGRGAAKGVAGKG